MDGWMAGWNDTVNYFFFELPVPKAKIFLSYLVTELPLHRVISFSCLRHPSLSYFFAAQTLLWVTFKLFPKQLSS